MNKERFAELFNMSGRVVVVTGGTRGIGRALAEGYAHAGAKVVVASRNPGSCEETEEYLRSLGGDALGVAADIGDLEDVSRIVTRTIEQFGHLDVLVNNAAMGGQHTVGLFSPRGLGADVPCQRPRPGLFDARRYSVPEEEFTCSRLEHPLCRRLLKLEVVPDLRTVQSSPLRPHQGGGCRACSVRDPSQRNRSGAFCYRNTPLRAARDPPVHCSDHSAKQDRGH